MIGYVYTNAKGDKYYLNSKEVQLNPRVKSTIFYFSKNEMPEGCELPADREVAENPKNGFPIVRRKKR